MRRIFALFLFVFIDEEDRGFGFGHPDVHAGLFKSWSDVRSQGSSRQGRCRANQIPGSSKTKLQFGIIQAAMSC